MAELLLSPKWYSVEHSPIRTNWPQTKKTREREREGRYGHNGGKKRILFPLLHFDGWQKTCLVHPSYHTLLVKMQKLSSIALSTSRLYNISGFIGASELKMASPDNLNSPSPRYRSHWKVFLGTLLLLLLGAFPSIGVSTVQHYSISDRSVYVPGMQCTLSQVERACLPTARSSRMIPQRGNEVSPLGFFAIRRLWIFWLLVPFGTLSIDS